MKSIDIRFFSSDENNQPKERKTETPKSKKEVLTGYISNAGKVVFPAKTVADLGIDIANAAFKVGMQEGKRKAKSLYVVPAAESEVNTFQFEKAAKSFTMSLPFILKKSGVDFKKTKYVFTIHSFDHKETTGFELQLKQYEEAPKVPYTGKPRGRRLKAKEGVE